MRADSLRFGNPFEFGLRYLLTGPEPISIKLSAANLIPGFYFWLVCPALPDHRFSLGAVGFPVSLRLFELSFPPKYFIEATTGAFYLAPFVIAALFIPFARRSILLWITLASSAAALLFLVGTGFTTQRYEVD